MSRISQRSLSFVLSAFLPFPEFNHGTLGKSCELPSGFGGGSRHQTHFGAFEIKKNSYIFYGTKYTFEPLFTLKVKSQAQLSMLMGYNSCTEFLVLILGEV